MFYFIYFLFSLSPVTSRAKQSLIDQLNAATELGLLIVTSFEENDREVDDVRLSQLKRVATAMTPGVEMSEFLKRAIRCVGEHMTCARPARRLAARRRRRHTGLECLCVGYGAERRAHSRESS